jgi:peptide/nickel transport system permease protein
MFGYIARRLAYGGVVVLGVLLLLFMLFFTVATPDDIARKAVGDKAMPAVIEQWKANHGYDKPVWPKSGHMTDNLLVSHFTSMLTFDFGKSDADGVPIVQRIKDGAGPSLALTVPLMVLGIVFGVVLSLFVAFFRETYIDKASVFLAVLALSVSILLYIIGGQVLFGKILRWFPVSGFDSDPRVISRFVALPIIVALFAGVGSDVRFYRTVFIEEIHKDYVRTARAKGCGEGRIMSRHVLWNAMIPVLTNLVMAIPFLFTGSLLLESFFGIPGLGALTVDAINGNDFSTLRAMVYIGSLLFILGQVLTDISYTLVDPRIRLE